jgi:chemosensory pili system protein ChpA (sensor histidine kinase/response regulator)
MPPEITRKVDADVLAGFLEEATGYLPQIRAGIAALGLGSGEGQTLEEAHRQAHCIKGAAAMVGLAGLSQIAAHLEEALEGAFTGTAPLPTRDLPSLHQAVDLIESYLDSVQKGDLDEEALVQKTNQLFSEGPELLIVFKDEAEEHLRTINRLLPALVEQADNQEALQDIRRSVHTLKGSAATVGLHELARLAHRMEDLLDLLHDGQRSNTPETTALLVAATDALEELASGTVDPPTLAGLYQRLERALTDSPQSAEGPPAPSIPTRIAAIPSGPPLLGSEPPPRTEKYVRVPLDRLDELTRLVNELVLGRNTLEQQLAACKEQIETLQRGTDRLQHSVDELETGYELPALTGRSAIDSSFRAGNERETINRSWDFQSSDFDELELHRYTPFHQLSRALTETAEDLGTSAHDLDKWGSEFEAGLHRQAQLASEIQDRLTHLRLVPLATLAGRLQRTVRGVARSQKKEIQLVLEGETTKLDKLVLEELAEPLLHLLRNAADHGIESPQVRRGQGKSERGTIRIQAHQESTGVVVQISDDGAGIDPEMVRRAALAQGISPAEIEGAGAGELLDLLFKPGFSTAQQVSWVSGRGVGLDIVKTRVERLKGTVTVASRPGEGTAFTLRLPVPVALLKALLVRSAGQTFALALASILQIGRLHVDAVEEQPGIICLGDIEVPRIDLAEALQLQRTEGPVACPPVVVVRSAGQLLALVVDQLGEAREVVVKELGSHLRHVPGVAGATLLGDGSVVLILDPDSLVMGGVARSSRPVQTVLEGRPIPPPATILVVDDSPSVRRALVRLLRRASWKVLAARDGQEALELLEQARPLPDLMLVDVEMPRMDGYQLVSRIKANPALAQVPAVMVTSRSTAKHRRKAEEVGACDFVVKPFQDDHLLGVVLKWMRVEG